MDSERTEERELLANSGRSLFLAPLRTAQQKLPASGDTLQHSAPGFSAEQLATVLDEYARQFNGRRRDDIAILALRFVGRSIDHEPPPADQVLADEPALRGA
jgi:hypothetical protein